jgi:hypothetical protein
MFFDDAQSESDTPESGIRFAMMLAELWHAFLSVFGRRRILLLSMLLYRF